MNPDYSSQIDQLCDDFEDDLRAGKRPELRYLLEQVPEPARPALLKELLALEAELLEPEHFQERLQIHRRALPEVAELLEQLHASPGIPETALPKPENTTAQTATIGPFRILKTIGEGGMGSVYLAQQDQPVRRRVALKVIKRGLDSKQVIARFEAERQALAMMDHPSIARILDAGTTHAGQPFFAMEWVKGIPLTQYCDKRKLSVPERLDIFRQVCDAVQHAHQKGIIHRDLKPSNILVAEYEGKPVPKVIDFGLAKALDTTHKLTEKTMFTEFGQVIGTLKYMSPEQAGLDALDIDTRSDIYSLGVILYELLTGSTPIDDASLRQGAILKLLQIVREQEPPRPSSRLSTDKQTLSTVTEKRQIDPRKLTQILSGDLDWIVMKALDKDRNRRYESAAAFAEDVLHFLSSEPVTARPPSTAYRLQKFVNKNKGFVGATSLITLLLVAGIIGTSIGFFKANRALQDAIRQKQIAEEKTELARRAEADQRRQKEIANQARIEADEAATRSAEVLDIVAESFISTSPEFGMGVKMTAKQVLDRALESLSGSELDPAGRVELLEVLSVAFFGLGDIDSAISTASHEVAERKQLYGTDDRSYLQAVSRLAAAYQAAGRLDEAKSLFETTLAQVQFNSGSESRDVLFCLNNLATAYEQTGEIEQAIEMFQKVAREAEKRLGPAHLLTLSSRGNLGRALRLKGDLEEAFELLENVTVEMKASLGSDHPETLKSMNSLAQVLESRGELELARSIGEEVLNTRRELLGPDHPDTLSSMNNLGSVLHSLGQIEKAITLYEKTLDVRQEKNADHPELLTTRHNLGRALLAAGRPAEAIEILEENLEARRKKMGPGHLSTITSMNALALAYNNTGRAEDAMTLSRESIKRGKTELGEDHPEILFSMSHLAASFLSLDRIDEAIEIFEELADLVPDRLGPDHPETLKTINNLAVAYSRTGAFNKAIPLLERALNVQLKSLGRNHPDTLMSIANLGFTHLQAGNLETAIPLMEEAYQNRARNRALAMIRGPLQQACLAANDREAFQRLADDDLQNARGNLAPDSPELAGALESLGSQWLQFDEPNRAEELLQEAVRIRSSIDSDSWQTHRARSLLGEAFLGKKDYPRAEALLETAHPGLQTAAGDIPEDVRQMVLMNSVTRLIALHEALGQKEQVQHWKSELKNLLGGDAPAEVPEKSSSSGHNGDH